MEAPNFQELKYVLIIQCCITKYPKLTGLKQFVVLNIYYLRVSMDLVSQSDLDGKFCLGVTHEVAVKISAGATVI